MVEVGANQFSRKFKNPPREHMVEIAQMVFFFPIFVDWEQNRDLMMDITMVELEGVIGSFQKDEIPRIIGGETK
jgi:hypothetical protein